MSAGRDVLLLRDDADVPYLVPRHVLEQEELVAFRVGEDEYLLPRKELLASKVTGAQPTDHEEGVSVRMPSGTEFFISKGTLELARVRSDEEHVATEDALDSEVVERALLEFEIRPLGSHELGVVGRGFEDSYVS